MGEFKSDRLTDSSRIDTIDNALAALGRTWPRLST